MRVLSNLEPETVFYFFEDISRIPRGSGNMEQISAYLVDFAQKRGLAYLQDQRKNVVIVKEATPGYEDEEPIILQGHMDIVAVKKPDCDIDMEKEGLRLAIRGDEIYAEGTSLGGDDGIAIAYALAALDSHTLRHPRLEAILTVDEERGMEGARVADLSMITGRRMINIDSREEGLLLAGCAGGARVECDLGLTVEKRRAAAVEVVVGGLQGGHSGEEIHHGRGNSNSLFGRLLYRLTQKLSVGLCEADGGLAANAISRETRAVLTVDREAAAELMEIIRQEEKEIREELGGRDPEVFIRAGVLQEGDISGIGVADTRRAAAFLAALPNGVQGMSQDFPGVVETSLNMGVLHCENGCLQAKFAVRSIVESAKHALVDRVCALTELAGGSNVITNDYPGWRYCKNSPLREKMIAVYRKMYGKEPRVDGIHAGLECGILGSRLPGLDCVAIAPDMKGLHTTEETLSISSAGRVWEYLTAVLEEKG